MRMLIAYFLIALLIGGAIALVWWTRYNSYEQRYRRQRARDKARRDAARDAANPDVPPRD
jgi:hypothetical protein